MKKTMFTFVLLLCMSAQNYLFAQANTSKRAFAPIVTDSLKYDVWCYYPQADGRPHKQYSYAFQQQGQTYFIDLRLEPRQITCFLEYTECGKYYQEPIPIKQCKRPLSPNVLPRIQAEALEIAHYLTRSTIVHPCTIWEYDSKPDTCSKCGGKVATVLYGLYDSPRSGDSTRSDELQAALENNEVVFGGCVIYEDSPQWICTECGQGYGKQRKQQ